MNAFKTIALSASSPAALALAFSFFSCSAIAQEATAPSDAGVEEVIVTGTSIRGLAPVGSNLITVGQADIQTLAPKSMQEILANVPALMGFGNSGEATLIGVSYQPSIHGLGASASNSTLTLVDNHRIPGSGTTHTDYDPNIVPSNMIERVDVLADGASSIYGSDAVAGVVNFITRNKFDGVELSGQAGMLDSTTNWQGGLLAGKTWGDGQVLLGYTHSYEGKITSLERPYTATTNFTSRGGTNFNTFFCDPATIQPNGAGNIYLSPTSSVALANTAANSPCPAAGPYGDLLPVTKRDNVMLKASMDIGKSVTISSDLIFGTHSGVQDVSRGTVQATVYGAGPQANPFYINPPGVTATKQTIRWDGDALLGPGANIQVGSTSFLADVKTEYRIDDNYVVNVLALAGTDYSYINTYGKINGTVADEMLNGSDNSGGSATTALPNTGLVVPLTPLTTANALDVWMPAATNRTNPSLIGALSALTDSTNLIESNTSFQQLQAGVNGAVFELPAGPVKVAVGVSYKRDQFDAFQTSANNSGAGSRFASTVTVVKFGRTNYSAYAEADLPVIGPDMKIPLVQKFEVDISGRYDDYNDVGITNNPKAAFNWQVIDSLRLRGNYSTSFVAPPLDISGIVYPGNDYRINQTSSVGSATLNANIPVQLFPAITQFGIPGCTTSSVTCSGASLTGMSLNASPLALAPAKGRTWAIGADFSPDFVPGLSASATLWHNTLNGAFAGLTTGARLNTAALTNLTIFYPGGAPASAIAHYSNGVPASSPLPAVVQFITLSYTGGYLNIEAEGVDASVNYTMDTDYGTFKIGENVTQLLEFNQNYLNGPKFSILNSSGANNTFNSIALQSRATLGWSKDAFEGDLAVNYIGAYWYRGATPLNPVTLDSLGNPTGGGDHVHANVTFDFHGSYAFDTGILGNDEVSLTMRNMFNKAPPFYNAEDGRSDGFDRFSGDVLGRVTTLALKVKF